MQHSSSSSRHKVLSLLRYISLGLLLIIVSACHRAANLVPAGYEAVFSDHIIASTAARLDYPLIIPAHENDHEIKFLVSKSGVRTWFWEDGFWDLPSGWKPFTWYRIGLISDGKLICHADWTPVHTDDPMKKDDPKEITCTLKGKVNDYYDKPLVALLFFGVNGDEKKPPEYDDVTNGVVSRTLYLVREH
ncbi:MAG: hypothetical protein DMG05_30035 [Acidobacteria bacterium]|nr:MAG: hypothetical protein DMG05_30035 [Acidobacteriota bacterium]TMQ30900.1 MAG: hypothetical protein E6K65_03445 [Nitrospirota bacterium]